MVKNKRLDINFNQKLISGFLFMKNTMCTLSDAYKASDIEKLLEDNYHKALE